jgi:hypothetical protein
MKPGGSLSLKKNINQSHQFFASENFQRLGTSGYEKSNTHPTLHIT